VWSNLVAILLCSEWSTPHNYRRHSHAYSVSICVQSTSPLPEKTSHSKSQRFSLYLGDPLRTARASKPTTKSTSCCQFLTFLTGWLSLQEVLKLKGSQAEVEDELELFEIAWEHLTLLSRDELFGLTRSMSHLLSFHLPYLMRQDPLNSALMVASVWPATSACSPPSVLQIFHLMPRIPGQMIYLGNPSDLKMGGKIWTGWIG
jgi:hypothetical protein